MAVKPKCKLSNTDGNVFALAGRVISALQKAGQGDKAKEFSEKLRQAKSYAEAIGLMADYVEVC